MAALRTDHDFKRRMVGEHGNRLGPICVNQRAQPCRLRGAKFALGLARAERIERDQANRPKALWPRNPAATRPVRLSVPIRMDGELVPAGTMVYKTSDGVPAGSETPERIILASDIIHVPGLSLDGRIGRPVI